MPNRHVTVVSSATGESCIHRTLSVGSRREPDLPLEVLINWVLIDCAEAAERALSQVCDWRAASQRNCMVDELLGVVDPTGLLQTAEAGVNMEDWWAGMTHMIGPGCALRLGFVSVAQRPVGEGPPLSTACIDDPMPHDGLTMALLQPEITDNVSDAEAGVVNELTRLRFMDRLPGGAVGIHRLSGEPSQALGRGARGEVRLHRALPHDWLDDSPALPQKKVAIKWVMVQSIHELQLLRREVAIWRLCAAISTGVCNLLGWVDPFELLQHPDNLEAAKFMLNCTEGVRVGLVMPACRNGSLTKWLARVDPLSSVEPRLRVAIGIVEAVSTIHRVCDGLSVACNDIKPDNILMMGNKPLLIDFGTAQWYQYVRDQSVPEAGGPALMAASSGVPVTAADLLQQWAGDMDDSDDSDDSDSASGGVEAVHICTWVQSE